jgi:hypothetical protein
MRTFICFLILAGTLAQPAWAAPKPGDSALHIANANLSVPTPADELGPQEFTASRAYAVMEFAEDGTIRIGQLIGTYCGIKLRVRDTVRADGRFHARAARQGCRARNRSSCVSGTMPCMDRGWPNARTWSGSATRPTRAANRTTPSWPGC